MYIKLNRIEIEIEIEIMKIIMIKSQTPRTNRVFNEDRPGNLSHVDM
jgi:hypothetical protein